MRRPAGLLFTLVISLRAAVHFAFLLASAVLAELPEPPRADSMAAGPGDIGAAHPAQPLAFDVPARAPACAANTDSGPPTLWRDTGQRDGPRSASTQRDARVRARAAGIAHSDYASRRLAERSNRYIFGSTAPPSLL